MRLQLQFLFHCTQYTGAWNVTLHALSVDRGTFVSRSRIGTQTTQEIIQQKLSVPIKYQEIGTGYHMTGRKVHAGA